MKPDNEMRQLFANNLRLSMEWAGYENPNQVEVDSEVISAVYLHRLLRCQSAATVDTIGILAKQFDTAPSFFLAHPTIVEAAREVGSPKELYDQLRQLALYFGGTTDEGRKMILDIAALQPPRPDPDLPD